MTEVPEKKKRKWLRRLIQLFIVGLILGTLLFGALQTPPAKRLIARQINGVLASALPWPAEVEGVGGLVPVAVTVDAFRAGSPDAPWLELHDMALHVDILPLLRGEISVAHLAAAEIALHKLPPAVPEEAPSPRQPFSLPAIPDLPAWLRLGDLEVSRVTLGEPVLGHAAAFSVQGAYLPGTQETISIRIRGLDETQADLTLAGGIHDGAINLTLEATDATLAPALAGLEGPLSLALDLQGPKEDMAWTVELTRGEAPLAMADIRIAYGVPLNIAGTAQIQFPDDLVSPDVITKLGDSVNVEIDVTLDKSWDLAIDSTTAQTEHASLALSGVYGLASRELDLDPVLIYDDIRRLLDRPVAEGDAQRLEARVPVHGKLASLSITPTSTLAGGQWITGDLTLGIEETVTARGTVDMLPAGTLLPPDVQSLLKEGGQLDLDVTYEGTRLTLNDTRARIGETALTATGTVDPEAQVLDVKVDVRSDDLEAFETLAGTPLGGALNLTLTAKGDTSGTVIDGALDVKGVQANTLNVPSGSLAIGVNAGVFPDKLTDNLEIRLDGQFPKLQLHPDMVRDLNLTGTMQLEALKHLKVTGLDISDGNLAITADGTINLENRAADFKSRITVAQLGDYTAIANLPYRGKADFTLDVASGDAPGSLVALLDGRVNKLSGLPDEIEGIAGSAVTLSARADYDGTQASVRDIALSGTGLNASGQGSFNQDTEAVDARLNGGIDDLAPLSGLAGRPMSGSASFDVSASGTLDELSAEGTLRGAQLNVDVFRTDAAEITFTVSGLPARPTADLDATFSGGGDVLRVATAIVQEEQWLRVNTLTIDAGENQIAGSGTFDTTAMRGYGNLTAALPDLAALKTWFDLPLGGAIQMTAQLAEGSGTLTGDLSANGVEAAALKIGTAEGAFNVENVFEAPSGSIELSAGELDAGSVELAALTLSAEGPPNNLVLSVTTEGVYEKFTRFNVDGGGVLSDETLTFDLRDLKFGVEDFAFALREPATLSWSEGEALLSPLALDSEGGNLLVAGRYNADMVDVKAEWTELSLRLVELAGMAPMAGVLTGSVTITGSPGAPTVNAETELRGYNPRPGEPNDFPGLDSDIKVSIAEGALKADVVARVPEAGELNADATAPLTLALAPWNLAMPGDGALTGSLTGTMDLSTVPALLALEGHEIRGELTSDLALSGTMDTPGLDGTVRVSDGYYENGSSSTILNDLSLLLEADGNTLRLAELAANDMAGGSISGEGQWVLDPDQKSPFDFTLTLDHPRLVHRDDMRAQGDGKLRLTGDATGALLKGDLTVGPAYFVIPEGSDETEVTTVPYRVAGAAGEGEQEKPEPPFAFVLDLGLDFPGKIFVTGPGLDSEWDGKLKITEQAANPSVEGVLRVKKGTLDFLGHVFSLAESTITFDGQTPPAPYLRIDAVTNTEEIEAHVRMVGTADNLQLTLDSDPAMPRDEILARVLFGQRLSDVSPVQALTLARYAPMFRKGVSGRRVLGSEGPKPFLVDRISLNSGTEVGEASVTTGKYLSDEFYLEFQQGLGSAESLVSLDWLFAPQWSLKGKTTAGGEGGLGVFWKKNY